MRGKNRNSIADCLKLPQFTTMNVIDGQADLVIYSSLIFYSLTINNILNIIVLLILAGVTIATLSGEDGMLSKAENSKVENAKVQIFEEFKMIIVDIEIKYKGNATLQDIVTELENDTKNEYIIELPESASIKGEIPDVSNAEKINVIYKNYKFEVTKNLQVAIVDNVVPQNGGQTSQVTITFNANGGSISEENQQVILNIGAQYGQLPTPTREGYTFSGWYTENTNGTEVTSETVVENVNNQTLYAQWKQKYFFKDGNNYNIKDFISWAWNDGYGGVTYSGKLTLNMINLSESSKLCIRNISGTPRVWITQIEDFTDTTLYRGDMPELTNYTVNENIREYDLSQNGFNTGNYYIFIRCSRFSRKRRHW